MLYVCPTFDYELYLGGSDYSEYEVLVEPTKRLGEIFRKRGCKYTLFADTCAILQYKKNGLVSFPKMAEEQMKEVIRSGNDVQMHIHPHWYNAVYENGNWYVNGQFYRLHSFANIDSIVSENREYLCELLREEDSQYNCMAFRAGGFCLQPEKEILKILKTNGIVLDSSVCTGRRCTESPHYFDYRKINRKSAWGFNIEDGLNSSVIIDGDTFIEIPIATSGIGLKKIQLFLSKKTKNLPPGKGKYINEIESSKGNMVIQGIRLVKRFLFDPYMCEFDVADYERMLKILKPYLKRAKKCNVVIAIIGHPKMGWEGWFWNMEKFLDTITADYSDIIKTVTIQEAYRILINEK